MTRSAPAPCSQRIPCFGSVLPKPRPQGGPWLPYESAVQQTVVAGAQPLAAEEWRCGSRGHDVKAPASDTNAFPYVGQLGYLRQALREIGPSDSPNRETKHDV